MSCINSRLCVYRWGFLFLFDRNKKVINLFSFLPTPGKNRWSKIINNPPASKSINKQRKKENMRLMQFRSRNPICGILPLKRVPFFSIPTITHLGKERDK